MSGSFVGTLLQEAERFKALVSIPFPLGIPHLDCRQTCVTSRAQARLVQYCKLLKNAPNNIANVGARGWRLTLNRWHPQ
jgi:hypothetical protein